MLETAITLIAASAVFVLFVLVFARKDDHGQRGRRLTGCRHQGSGETCDHCRDRQGKPFKSDQRD